MARKIVSATFLMILMCVSFAMAAEDNYPSRTVEVIVQSAAGVERTSRQEF